MSRLIFEYDISSRGLHDCTSASFCGRVRKRRFLADGVISRRLSRNPRIVKRVSFSARIFSSYQRRTEFENLKVIGYIYTKERGLF